MSEHSKEPKHAALSEQIRNLAPITPDPAFKERVRRNFVGEVPYPREVESGFPRGRSPWPLIWGGSALAAAAALVIAFLTMASTPQWSVTTARGDGTFTVGQTEYAAADLSGMEIQPGTLLQTCPNGEVSLTVPGQVTMELSADARVVFGHERVGLLGRRLTARVEQGIAWGTTGPEFTGMKLTTDEAVVEVRGTTFAVIQDPEYTCVCLLEGTIEVTPAANSQTHRVSVDSRYTVFADGSPPEETPLPADERDRLAALRDRAARPPPSWSSAGTGT